MFLISIIIFFGNNVINGLSETAVHNYSAEADSNTYFRTAIF